MVHARRGDEGPLAVVPSSVTTEVVRDPDGLAELFEVWDDLLGPGPDASIYLTRAWVEPWWRHFDHRPLARDRIFETAPHVVVARIDGRPAALLPWLEVRMAPGVRVLVGIGQETADYGGALLGDQPERVLPALLDHIEEELGHGRTFINLTRLHPDSLLLHALRERFPVGSCYELRHHLTTPYPFIDLAARDDPAAYVERLAKRNDVLRRERRLAEAHEVTYEHHRPGRSSRDLATFLDLHRRRWESRPDEPDGIFATPSGQAFLVDASEALDAAGNLRISILRADGEPVVARYGTVFGGAYQGMKSGWDPDFAAYGPGHLAVTNILRQLAADGTGEMDMLRGAGDHKAAWTHDQRLVSYWVIGPAGPFRELDRRAVWALLRLRSRQRR